MKALPTKKGISEWGGVRHGEIVWEYAFYSFCFFFFFVELGHSFINLSEGFQEPKEVENFKCSFSSHCVGSTIESQRKQDCFSQHHTSANGHGFATRQVPPRFQPAISCIYQGPFASYLEGFPCKDNYNLHSFPNILIYF